MWSYTQIVSKQAKGWPGHNSCSLGPQQCKRRVHNVTLLPTDVRNHRQKHSKRNNCGLSEEDQLWNQLQSLADNGSDVTVIKDANDKMSVLFLQTAEMKSSWQRYPQTLFLDSTYKVNNRNMPLFVFMTCDGENAGIVVAYALVIDEKSSTVSHIIDIFKSNNDCSSLSSVTIDKDFSELRAVKEKLPHAEIILCKFHVLKAFEERTKKRA
ncbi:Zinc finger swim domain-containing protein 1 [Plakobranchus ocellatus]|uniref:Zinc finger swim domain-containing protein 1 n=1 Tax=Plakobranchus ocellatus TaxID=259542 RepID=A0AAV4ACD4_9GAST|nr:Zinc finger swim domain-containing protein 1 [Plakobranchus ocellatus]